MNMQIMMDISRYSLSLSTQDRIWENLHKGGKSDSFEVEAAAPQTLTSAMMDLAHGPCNLQYILDRLHAKGKYHSLFTSILFLRASEDEKQVQRAYEF